MWYNSTNERATKKPPCDLLKHYKETTMSIPQSSQNKQCAVKFCNGRGKKEKNGKRYLTRGYCISHYWRLMNHGDPLGSAESRKARPAIIEGDIAKIPIGINAKHGYAIVDKEYAYLADKYLWTINNTGYALTTIWKSKWSKSRGSSVAYFLHHAVAGKPDKGMVTDHINGNPLDNRIANLRATTQGHNMQNAAVRSHNTSGYTGVYANRLHSGMFWKVIIHKNGKAFYGGRRFKTAKEAAKRYNELALELYGKNARLNDV